MRLPFLALAPMDGVTDAAFRRVVDEAGGANLMITEFTSAEGLAHGAIRLLQPLIKHNTKTFVWGQLFGSNPMAFYKGTLIVAAMGLDGVDLNMGCPNRTVTRHGAGADLINQPKLAQELIKICQQATKDWQDGITLEQAGIHSDVVDWIKNYPLNKLLENRKSITVSIKTRIGYETENVTEWVTSLLETRPYAISLHGRTFRQMYRGQANWDAISRAVALAKGNQTLILGNGDVQNQQEALQKIKDYDLDGILIGRASLGNPYVFSGKLMNKKIRLSALLQHAQYFTEMLSANFHSFRKHIGWYCKDFSGAAQLRKELMLIENMIKLQEAIKKSLSICAEEANT